MTMMIDFSPQVEAQIIDLARQQGIDPTVFVKQVVVDRLSTAASPEPDAESRQFLDLLQAWRDEDLTNDVDELKRRDAETDELMKNLEANRVDFPILGV